MLYSMVLILLIFAVRAGRTSLAQEGIGCGEGWKRMGRDDGSACGER